MGERLLISSHCCYCSWTSNIYRATTPPVSPTTTTTITTTGSGGRRKTRTRRFLAWPRASPKPLPEQQRQPDFDLDNGKKDDDDGKGNDEDSNAASSFPSDDLNFLWKLVAGSVGGAAVIKYGSALFPEITRPNIFLAMLMVGMPVLVSVLLLIKQSSITTQNQDSF